MPESVLDVLKLVLLVLLYLFFARVLWAVWSEVRQPVARSVGDVQGAAAGSAATDPTTAAPRDPAAPGPTPRRRRDRTPRPPKPPKGNRHQPGRLVVLEPAGRRGQAYAIGAGVTIGREPDNTIAIADDTYLSGHHAKIAPADGRVVVVDLTSRNGTFLNGARLAEPRSVNTGDRIQIGYTLFEAQ